MKASQMLQIWRKKATPESPFHNIETTLIFVNKILLAENKRFKIKFEKMTPDFGTDFA